MTSNEFTLWLHGFFELTDATELTPVQVGMIREHLDLVFNKVTKPLAKPTPPPTKMLWEDEDLYKRKYIKQLEDLAEEIKAKQLDREAWKKLIEEPNKKVCPGFGDFMRPYHKEESPYNNTPIVDWTVRFPTNIMYCATNTTGNLERPCTLTKTTIC